MIFLGTLLTDSTIYLQWPGGLAGWLWLLGFVGGLGGLAWRWRKHQPRVQAQGWVIIFGLAGAEIFFTLFFGLRLSPGRALPVPMSLVLPAGLALMAFSAVPWVLAAGLVGPLASMGLAGLSGLLLAGLDTHAPFTIFEYALAGLVFGAAVQQRYRTLFFRVIRRPLGAGLLVLLGYPALFIWDKVLGTPGDSLPVVLDFVLSHTPGAVTVLGGGLLVGVLVGEAVALVWAKGWGGQPPFEPSPAERSLETRSLYLMGPLVGLMVLVLTVVGWSIAGSAAQRLMRDRMASTAQIAAESVPFALEVGQNLILQMASNRTLAAAAPAELPGLLMDQLRLTPYFTELMMLDGEGNLLGEAPELSLLESVLFPEEQVAVELAAQGVSFQYYTVQPAKGGATARLSFLAAVEVPGVGGTRVLVGRSDMAVNPFTAPIFKTLDSLQSTGGEGLLLDESGRILYHPNPNLVLSPYPNRPETEIPIFYDETGPEGTRELVYFQPVVGRSWAVAIKVSAQEVQQLALTIAAPLLALLALLSLVLLAVLRVVLRVITGSLRSLAVEANRIARDQDELGSPLKVGGEDEVGQMRRAFEQMRMSLKARLDEQEQFLLVSRGVASSLEMEAAVKPILKAALTTGAVSARVVLSSAALPEYEDEAPSRFALGPAAAKYGLLDDQMLALTQQQARVVLTNPPRASLLTFAPNDPVPVALLAVALRHESLFYGALWVAYDKPRQFLEDEIRFLTTLAGQAALAAANARLFMSAEVGRQRLAAILASTPDPVLVTDHQNRLLLANPVAWGVLGDGLEPGAGVPIEQVISQREVIDLLRAPSDDTQSMEITLPNRRVYFATASSVIAEGKRVGRVCVLRDITHFKELDALKSEFVSTVSHDLRSPLTLMRGYATMLQMVGDLNEQQKGYVKKIVTGVESMSRLVNNLLDLGRIEAGVGLKLEMVPVVDTLSNVVSAFQMQAAQKQIQMTTEYPPQTNPVVEADPALLQQAFQNLIENALKYTQPGGRVHLKLALRPQREGLLFEVRDTGIGIAPLDQPRLFERFFRAAHRESRKQKGSGLGLAIVKSIVDKHHGRVWVESQLGKGSVFSMEIPLRQPR